MRTNTFPAAGNENWWRDAADSLPSQEAGGGQVSDEDTPPLRPKYLTADSDTRPAKRCRVPTAQAQLGQI